MATVADIRSKILNKIFTPYGKSVTLSHAGTHLYDDRGDLVQFVSSSSTITIVPYDISQDSVEYAKFSDFDAGDMAAAIPYSVTISVGDRITMEGDTWVIKEIIPHYLPSNLVYITRLSKLIA